ncbi:unnamed protein product [Arctogadus glacialis]
MEISPARPTAVRLGQNGSQAGDPELDKPITDSPLRGNGDRESGRQTGAKIGMPDWAGNGIHLSSQSQNSTVDCGINPRAAKEEARADTNACIDGNAIIAVMVAHLALPRHLLILQATELQPGGRRPEEVGLCGRTTHEWLPTKPHANQDGASQGTLRVSPRGSGVRFSRAGHRQGEDGARFCFLENGEEGEVARGLGFHARSYRRGGREVTKM